MLNYEVFTADITIHNEVGSAKLHLFSLLKLGISSHTSKL